MEQQVRVADAVHTAVGEQRADMLVQLLTDAEGVVQFLHQQFFLGRQCVGGRWVDGGEIATLHLIRLAVDGAGLSVVVNVVEQTAVLHTPFWVTLEDACLFLQLDHGDGLVHLGGQLESFLVHSGVWLQQFGDELLTRIFAIHFEGEGGQGHEVDAVFLDGGEVGVAQTEAQHVADAGIIAG